MFREAWGSAGQQKGESSVSSGAGVCLDPQASGGPSNTWGGHCNLFSFWPFFRQDKVFYGMLFLLQRRQNLSALAMTCVGRD